MPYSAERVNNALAFHLSDASRVEAAFDASRHMNLESGITTFFWPPELENETLIVAAHQSDCTWGLHDHDYYVLNYIYSGAFLIRIDGMDYRMEKDALSILQPGAAHRITSCSSEEPSILLSIAARKELMYHSFLPLISESALFLDFFMPRPNERDSARTIEFRDQHNETIRKLFCAALVESFQKEAGYSKILECIFASVLIFLSRSYREYFKDERKGIGVKTILDYIARNCSTVTLQEMADMFHYHPGYLSSVLRRETGRPFSVLVKDFKIARACQLLEQTSLPVNNVAVLAGYPHLGNFYKVFKAETGSTPNEYRQLKGTPEEATGTPE